MVLPILCAGALLTADCALRIYVRRRKPERALWGGRIRLGLLENPGMAGGVLKNHPRLARALPCGALAAVLILSWGELLRGRGPGCWGAALLCAGGLGNVLERLARGRVTDYISFPRLPGRQLRRLVWNLADLMLLAGALLLTAGSLIG